MNTIKNLIKCDNCGIERNPNLSPYCHKCGPLHGMAQVNGSSLCEPVLKESEKSIVVSIGGRGSNSREVIKELNKQALRASIKGSSHRR